MGNKTPPFRGKKRKPNRNKTQSITKGRTNPPKKSTKDKIVHVTLQPKNNINSKQLTITTTLPPQGKLTPTTVTPMKNDITSNITEDIESPLKITKDEKINNSSNCYKNTVYDGKIKEPSQSELIQMKSTQNSKKSTFLLHKELYEQGVDLSKVAQSNPSHPIFKNSIRMTMMFKIPSKEEGCSEKDAPIVAIQKMNEMLKSLSNKLPCRVGPWLDNTLTNGSIQDSDLINTLPEDIDFVEAYVYEYNRFIQPGKNGYVRLRIFFSDLTSKSEIKAIAAQFKTPRERFLEQSHSDSTNPVHIGCLTGSVKSMTESKDFYNVFKTKFDLTHLGFWWTQPKGEITEFDRRKFSLHIEIDRQDLPKRETIEQFFKKGNSVKSAFFGTPMILTKPFNYNLENNVKSTIEVHARKQFTMGKSLQSTIIYGAQLSNWANSSKTSTLFEELMRLTSITEKSVIKGNSKKKFQGRLFHAIVPDQINKTVEFYYTKANSSEGSSVARALPLFIRDYYKKSPDFFCDSELVRSALEGEWNFSSRRFLSADEKEENQRLEEIEDAALAEVEIFISKEQQKLMATDKDDISVETRLTKNDKSPPSVNCDISEMTGSTRESKAQRYADKAVKEVASQYTTTISTMQHDIAKKDDKITELQKQLNDMKSLATYRSTNNPSTLTENSTTDITTESNIATISSHLHIEIDDDDISEGNTTNYKELTEERKENIRISSKVKKLNRVEDTKIQQEKQENEYKSISSPTFRGSKRTGEEVKSSLYRSTRARKNHDTLESASIDEVDPDL